MLTYIKQHLSNIWSSLHEKVKQHCGWIEKIVGYKKSMYSDSNFSLLGLTFLSQSWLWIEKYR